MPLADPYLLGPDFAQNGKSTITPRNLLLHNAGFPADPFPSYGSSDFGCPATNSSLHPPLVFTCSDLILQAVFKQTLKNPVGAVFLYSDLSMITLSFTLGKLVQQLQLVAPSDLLPVCAGALCESTAGDAARYPVPVRLGAAVRNIQVECDASLSHSCLRSCTSLSPGQSALCQRSRSSAAYCCQL